MESIRRRIQTLHVCYTRVQKNGYREKKRIRGWCKEGHLRQKAQGALERHARGEYEQGRVRVGQLSGTNGLQVKSAGHVVPSRNEDEVHRSLRLRDSYVVQLLLP